MNGRAIVGRLAPQQLGNPAPQERAVIVSADDFGLSSGVNRGVIEAHQRGVLTNASLMANGAAFEEAVDLARSFPTLAVGLHLVLLQGKATLPAREIPGLVSDAGFFRNDPVRTGIRYFFLSQLRTQLEREVRAQIEKFLATGLPLSHVDGHLNIHMHPSVLAILLEVAEEYGIRALRLPREPLCVSLRANWSEVGRKLAESITFRALCRHARPLLDERRIVYPDQVFGLHQSGHMTEAYWRGVIERLPPGVTEIYTHASYLDAEAARWRPADYECERELRVLLSPELRQWLERRRIGLTNYRDLTARSFGGVGLGGRGQ